MIDVDVKITGPVYDGRAAAAVKDFLDETTRELSDLAVNEIQSRLRSVLKDDTGHYRSKVITDRASSDASWIVSDQGVAYGPWLEGTSSRNKSTRFKGYQTFRRTRQWLGGKTGSVADANLARHVEQMGGE